MGKSNQSLFRLQPRPSRKIKRKEEKTEEEKKILNFRYCPIPTIPNNFCNASKIFSIILTISDPIFFNIKKSKKHIDQNKNTYM